MTASSRYLLMFFLLGPFTSLCAFTGSITFAVDHRSFDEAAFSGKEYHLDYYIQEETAIFTRGTVFGEAQCTYTPEQLNLALELFGELRQVVVEPEYFNYFRVGHSLLDFEQNGRTRLFNGITCIGYDLFFEGEAQFVGEAYCMPNIDNVSLDLPDLPSMPIFYEIIEGYEVTSYRAIGIKEGKLPAYIANAQKKIDATSFLALEESFSQEVFVNPELREQFQMTLVVKGYVTDALQPESVPLKNMDVKVYSGKKLILATKTDPSGYYSIKLPLGMAYSLHYGDRSVVKKIVEYNTKDIPYIDQVGGFSSAVDIGLFKPKSGVDYSLAEEPIGQAFFYLDKRIIDFDMTYTYMQRAKIEAAIGNNWF